MDPRFPNFMIGELETLLAEYKAAQQPSNVQLFEVVQRTLRSQYDVQREPRAGAGSIY